METYKVYYDYTYLAGDDKITVGVVIYDEDDQPLAPPSYQQFKGRGPQNKHNLTYSTQAFLYAIEVAEEYGLEDVTFLNQNEHIYNWVMDPNSERPFIQEVRAKLYSFMTTYDTEANFKVIKGKENKAKKALKDFGKSKSIKMGVQSFKPLVKQEVKTKDVQVPKVSDDELKRTKEELLNDIKEMSAKQPYKEKTRQFSYFNNQP